MLILLWGLGTERPFEVMCEELERQGLPTLLVDQRELAETEVELRVGAEVGGFVRTRGREVDLRSVTAAYVRPCDTRLLPAVARAGPESALWRHAGSVADMLSIWVELTPALVVNRFSSMGANGSKPYQLDLIRRHGFRVPDTLVTTDPDAVREFRALHGEIIYKSVSSVRSIVSRLKPEQLDRLADVVHCPTQFQQYVPGVDHRVHVIGEEIFPCEIDCAATDYRYPGDDEVELRACRLPPEVEERCLRMAAAMGLPVAGIDLRRTPDGEWFCLEVNPSPAYSYYQAQAGLPISEAVARLLASAGAAGRATKARPALPFPEEEAPPALTYEVLG
jgi:glutathione synthase/RimK-type ligase-like ATP-grasp enzyme